MPKAGRIAPAGRRSTYREGSIAAHVRDFLGKRGSILVLTQRLEGLERSGPLGRISLPEPAEVQVYEQTAAGYAVRPVIEALCVWGARMSGGRQFISPSALMISIAAVIEREARLAVRVGFDLGRESFHGTVAQGCRTAERGPAEGDLVFAGSANALAPVI